jgi:hypothetical protein
MSLLGSKTHILQSVAVTIVHSVSHTAQCKKTVDQHTLQSSTCAQCAVMPSVLGGRYSTTSFQTVLDPPNCVSKEKLKNNGNEASYCFQPFVTGNMSGNFRFIVPYIVFQHI